MMKPRVLLTNDDGPPSSTESPYVLGLYLYLTRNLGWDVKVVLPSSQKSWIGKAFHIKEVTKGQYFYPNADGRGERSNNSRPLRDVELGEWILLDATPATCANIGLHNIYEGQIDLVISGPNLGRNSSSAFALSSGTIGAALSGSLSKTRSIAISYGTVIHPTPTELFEPAHALGCSIIQHLWENWGQDDNGLKNGEVDFYSINIPLIEGLLSEEGLKICWTSMWRSSYARLFKNISSSNSSTSNLQVNPAGPDSLSNDSATSSSVTDYGQHGDLVFKWAPDMRDLVNPSISALPVGSDGWAIHNEMVSVTPLRASFGEPPVDYSQVEDRIWKMRL